ncbi:hypothetical protein EJD97_003806 [Solanum chilense]|uniref:Uncharacterized protein n=1 Tax=Solanum chilense TaxID=4083 RepID=A0A6N2BTU0_SOLCI|nr:hypothetical protein EJD97_003806 [Solanum chilense]
MSNLSKLEFVTLDISGKNYLSWVLDSEIHLTAKGLGLKGRYDHLKTTILPRKYSEPISCLLVAEQHNDLLMKNHEAHPAGSVPLPKAHAVDAHNQSEIRQNNSVHESMCGHGKGKRRYNNCRGCDHNKRENNIGSENNPSKEKDDHCHRCGLKGH